MLKHIASSNGGAIITGLLCLAILILLKKVNERFKNKLPVPIPAELLVVMLSIILCIFYQVKGTGTNLGDDDGRRWRWEGVRGDSLGRTPSYSRLLTRTFVLLTGR